jgi:MFS family permease
VNSPEIPLPVGHAAGQRWPLYAAGFTTAFGAHAVAAGLGAESADIGLSLLGLGILLALYDIAEVFLKPVFGALSDRIGPKPVIVGGLLAFSAASLIGLWADQPALLAAARLGQGMAASAFSPASSSSIARLAGRKTGHYFGRYGSWKGLGYAIGPLLGALAILSGGFGFLFGILSALGLGVAVWTIVSVPQLKPLPGLDTPSRMCGDKVRSARSLGLPWCWPQLPERWAPLLVSSPPWQLGKALARRGAWP